MSTPPPGSQSTNLPIYQRPVELLQHLIRFDTTNPPGNEAASIAYVNEFRAILARIQDQEHFPSEVGIA
jgi:hypothetical protein